MQKISLVIPTMNATNMLYECIETFKKHNGDGHEIVVCDDGSREEVRNQVREWCSKQSNVRHFFTPTNEGFSKTVNRGIKEATGDIIVLVNNDILFTQNVVTEIERTFTIDDRIGVVGALLFYPSMNVQHGGIFRAGYGFGHRGHSFPIEKALDAQKEGYLIGVTGALFAIKRPLLQSIGMLREDFFLSCEDTEYCIRAWQKGWRVYYNPNIRAIHKEGETRGNTANTKMIKGRHWYIKEMETFNKFQTHLRTVDFVNIDQLINRANIEHAMAAPVETPAAGQKEVSDIGTKVVGKKILIVKRMGALGDVLLTTPVIRKLKQTYPQFAIHVVTGCPDVFTGNRDVEKIHANMSTVDLGSCALFDLDMAYEKEPKILVPHAYSKAVFGHVDVVPRPIMYSDESQYQSAKAKLGVVNPEVDKMVMIHMAVSWENRTWPRDSWMRVAREIVTRGFKLVVVGKGGDFECDLLHHVYNMKGKFNIFEIRELMKRAKAFISVDSGLFHIAMTTECPTVGLFTVANPEYRVTRKERTFVVTPKVECKYCLHNETPPVTYVGCRRGDRQCLKDITPAMVMEATEEAMRS